MSAKEKENKKLIARVYRKTLKGRATCMASVYRKIDNGKGIECDMDWLFMLLNIVNKPCAYCGDTDSPIGCDRIDNKKGHTKDNVVPCCGVCNVARGDNFTHVEMKTIGLAIAEVKSRRKARGAPFF